MTHEEILSRFQVIRRYSDKAQCRCPCHDDKQASLTISKGRKGAMIYCHAGCSFEDVIQAVGLKKQDLFYESKPPNSNWRAYIESREKRRIEAVYNYVSFNGNYAFTKIRMQEKKMICGMLSNGRFTYGLGGRSRKELSAVYAPNGIQDMNRGISEGKPIFIPEGERDVDILVKQGYIALTYGGVNDWTLDMAQLFKGAVVYVLADNDEPGRRIANTIQSDLQGIAKSARVVIPMPDIPKADISDYFEAGHSREEFEQLLKNDTVKENVRESAEKDISIASQGHRDALLENRLKDLHAEKYETSDKGFGRLFAEVFKDKHRYNPSRKDFMRYDGKRWVDDIEGLSARASAKDLSDALVRYAVGVDTEGKYLKAVAPLCNIRNRNNMLQDSRDVYFFNNEQLDVNDYFLNVQNGTLDLSGNEPIFLKHDPDMLISKICNARYNPAADCKLWKKFLMEALQGDTEKIKYIQKFSGLSLTGNTEQEECYVLYGKLTRNGKSTYCETMIYILGDYAVTMKAETLAVRQNLDSRQASGDIARLAGCRFCNAPEPQKRMIFDTALLKSLLGRDSITARHLYQREFSFIPKFKLIINTNFLPIVADDTVFSSGRIKVISFDKHFSENEQDKHLKEKLKEENELSGILNWCLEGLRLYREEGLNPPESVRKATEAYRSDSDKVGSFIGECLTKADGNTKAKDVYEVYAKWCNENGYGTENKSNFFAELKTKGIFSASGTVNGKTVRNVVVGHVLAEEDFRQVEEDIQFPFD